MNTPLRIGTLGAAKITPAALIKPALQIEGVEVVAVAARDRARAEAFATKHGVRRIHDSYESLLDDPDIDAVYNPLPNGLHGLWTRRALAAGKHVLCEKPLTANATEATEVAAATGRSGLVVMEAFHWRHHPLANRMLDVVGSGVIGEVRRIETWVCFPLPLRGDIRYRLDLAGGATMDAGCYAINMARTLAGAEPTVVWAKPKLSSPGVDRAMEAELDFGNGVSGRINASMFSRKLLRVAARVIGSEGRMDVLNPLTPQMFNRLTIRAAGTRTSQRVRGDATYTYQLRGFVTAVREGAPILTTVDDAVANMRVIDSVYEAAGLPLRLPVGSTG